MKLQVYFFFLNWILGLWNILVLQVLNGSILHVNICPTIRNILCKCEAMSLWHFEPISKYLTSRTMVLDSTFKFQLLLSSCNYKNKYIMYYLLMYLQTKIPQTFKFITGTKTEFAKQNRKFYTMDDWNKNENENWNFKLWFKAQE